MRQILLAVGVFAAISSAADDTQAQQVTVTTPLIGVNDSYYEHINLGWGMHRRGPGGSWFLNYGGPMAAIPPYGGYVPGNDFRFGMGTSGFGGGAHFQLSAAQGSSRSMTMVAPSVTMMNGARGSIFSGSIRPFVTGLIPVVGDYPVMVPYAEYPQFGSPPPMLVSPLVDRIERLRAAGGMPARAGTPVADDALVLDGAEGEAPPAAVGSADSTAARGDIGLAEIRRLQAAEDAARRAVVDRLVAEARQAERDSQWGVARVRYRQAAEEAHGAERQKWLDAAAKLNSTTVARDRVQK